MKIFESDITASNIDSQLIFVDRNSDSSVIKEKMSKYDFDVLGTTDDEGKEGYVENANLDNGSSYLNFNSFDSSDLIADTTPLIDVFPLLREEPHRLFVLYGNQIRGIITISDLQKIPVRIFLFGLISILEMKVTQIIRNRYKNETWEQKITYDRLKPAKKLHERQKLINENIELLDCLMLFDKNTIILKTNDVIDKLGYSKNNLKKIFGRILNLRDTIAHSRDLTNLNSSKIIDLSIDIGMLLKKMRKFEKET